MTNITVHITRKVVEYVDIELDCDTAEEAIAECEDQLASGDEISGWDYLTPPVEEIHIKGDDDESPGAYTQAALDFLEANNIEAPEHLLRLGFDAACELPGANRTVVKGLFATAQEEVRAKLLAAARFNYSFDGAIKVACDADPDYKARALAYLRGDDE